MARATWPRTDFPGALWDRGLVLAAAAAACASVVSCSKDSAAKMMDAGSINPEAGGGEQYADRPATDVPEKEMPVYPGRTFVEVYGIFGDKTGTFGCAGSTCHLPLEGGTVTSYGGDLHMDTVVSACSDLVNVDVREAPGKKRVVPYKLDESYLWCKLTTTNCMTREPRGAKMNPLTTFYSDVIKSWIEENGAHCP